MRKALIFLSWLIVVLGVTSSLLQLLFESDLVVAPTSLSIVAVVFVALVLGYVLHRPPLFIAAGSLFTFVVLGGAVVAQQEQVSTQDVELLFLAAMLIVNASLFRFLHLGKRADKSSVLPDGLIVGCGAWILVWVTLIQPSLDIEASYSVTITQAAVLGATITAIFLVTLIGFSRSFSSLPLLFFGLAVTATCAAMVLRALSINQLDTLPDDAYITALLIALACVGAAIVHPSVHVISRSRPLHTSASLMFQLTIISVSLIVPVLLLALTDPQDTADRIIRTSSMALLAIIVIIRVSLSAKQNAQAKDHLMRNALTDSLTGLPNRILMLEHISDALQRSWLTHQRPTVLFIDVDRFKNINDSLGHSTGDIVLTHVASRLLLAVPSQATVARISGDEFVILDPSTQSPTQSVLLAEKVLDSLRVPVPTSNGEMFVTASIGVAYAAKNIDLSADALLRHADTAMYRAKDAGRNCIALFDDTMLEIVTKRLEIETALYRALEREELQMVFQPIIDMSIGMVVGFEALMRWNREDQTIAPNDFIPIAEETGIIVPLGSWALNDALLQLRVWIDTQVVSPHTTMSVNVSAHQLHDPEFVTQVRGALSNASIAPEQLSLEVTESIMITEDSHALVAMKNLAHLGVRIAVDDFGTGYSSLSVLHHFPLHTIKIDRAFVNNLTGSPDGDSLVRTIIAMADALTADVIAEGIESSQQMKTLLSLKCTKAQGYFFSRPVDASFIPQVVAELENRDTWLNPSGE
jgi:diguanylate cyclase (GGDEF)-like protein